MLLRMLSMSIRLRRLGKDFGEDLAKIESIMRAWTAWIDKNGHRGYQQPACSPLNKLRSEGAVTG